MRTWWASFSVRGWLKQLRERVRMVFAAHLDPADVGVAIGLGIFIGCLPIFGLHLPLCLAVSRRFRLNGALVYGAANISNPFFAPFLIAAEVALGRWILGVEAAAPVPEDVERPIWTLIQDAPDLLLACGLGGVVIGVILGVALGLLAWGIALRWARRALPKEKP